MSPRHALWNAERLIAVSVSPSRMSYVAEPPKPHTLDNPASHADFERRVLRSYFQSATGNRPRSRDLPRAGGVLTPRNAVLASARWVDGQDIRAQLHTRVRQSTARM